MSWVAYEFPEEMQKRINVGCCGASIGKGWYDVVVELDRQLAKLYPYYIIDQIKEKFGGLRYYVSDVGEEGYKLIDEAERKCEKICEVCGKPGKKVSPRGWLRVRCEEHTEGETV